jgi:hypothetical protein
MKLFCIRESMAILYFAQRTRSVVDKSARKGRARAARNNIGAPSAGLFSDGAFFRPFKPDRISVSVSPRQTRQRNPTRGFRMGFTA